MGEVDSKVPFRAGVPEHIKMKITTMENRLSATLTVMYACPVCGSEMYTIAYPIVACPQCGHEQKGTNVVGSLPASDLNGFRSETEFRKAKAEASASLKGGINNGRT